MTSDLEKEAREAAEAAFPPGPGRLGGKLYAGKPAKEGFRERSWFQKGYLAAAEPREKELAQLRLMTDTALDALESRNAEIASLRAKLKAVPVEEIQRASWWHGAGGRIKDALAIDRWLAGLK